MPTDNHKASSIAAEDDPQGFLWRIRNRLHIPAAVLGFFLAQPVPETVVAGIVLLVLGLLLRTWAMGCISKKEVLCTHGPYGMVRHPLYIGNIIIVAGFLVLARSWLLALIVGPYTIFHYWAVIRSEEKWLADRFGEEWTQYASRVPLILPKPAWVKGAFSWKLAVENGVWPSWLGVLAAAAALAAKPYVLALIEHQ
ncbi:MAG: isoprenylcysteine carboxylmethyltransferase family protein [Armatimonadetes bacterium]|nr:isoprenylcysteine carboxylmethyltransferase family protein [Armatimonadota bacterium]